MALFARHCEVYGFLYRTHGFFHMIYGKRYLLRRNCVWPPNATHCEVYGFVYKIHGSFHIIYGSFHIIYGSFHIIYGSNATHRQVHGFLYGIRGSFHIIYGSFHIIYGSSERNTSWSTWLSIRHTWLFLHNTWKRHLLGSSSAWPPNATHCEMYGFLYKKHGSFYIIYGKRHLLSGMGWLQLVGSSKL